MTRVLLTGKLVSACFCYCILVCLPHHDKRPLQQNTLDVLKQPIFPSDYHAAVKIQS